MTDPTMPVICTECEWTGHWCDVEQIQDPKPDWDWHQWQICPLCREADHITAACDEPSCTKVSTCGWPDESGRYRRTCGEHMRMGASK